MIVKIIRRLVPFKKKIIFLFFGFLNKVFDRTKLNGAQDKQQKKKTEQVPLLLGQQPGQLHFLAEFQES
ncbi:hypothetical protein HAN_1g112 (nucleomorph) [Hemiselmis andersenii]|uniref:Uncharacterized protein n=1 Tax=Hemiselmis andersenii TaxID=464988 RepID=A9BKB9_HEMAN|nr:hypothetical protein HAN_1g112 [Hemiselmis andersenii]ABW97952.1 hypothetical protein HAN_1g112 [Hemiselmis andersenii]